MIINTKSVARAVRTYKIVEAAAEWDDNKYPIKGMADRMKTVRMAIIVFDVIPIHL